MFAKSQCWCVDGVSKFVLKIRDKSYYRIELPLATDEDKAHVGDLQIVLDQILQYEKTPCPFQRGFTVDLPESPETPVKKVPWRPKHSHRQASSEHSTTIDCQSDRNNCQGNNDQGDESPGNGDSASDNAAHMIHSPPRKVADFPLEASDVNGIAISDCESDEHDLQINVKQRHNDLMKDRGKLSSNAPLNLPRRLVTARTTTAPPQLDHPMRSSVPTSISSQSSDSPWEYHSLPSSVDSFHSLDSDGSSMFTDGDPPVDVVQAPEIPALRRHRREQSEVTVTASSQPLWDLSEEEAPAAAAGGLGIDRTVHQTTAMDIRRDELTTSSPPGLRVRRTFRKRRAQSPLPPSANLLLSPSPSRELFRCPMTTSLMHRTCSYLLKPPIQLVALMIHIAMRITRGAFQGSTFVIRGSNTKVPCTWDFSSDNGETGDDDDEEDEDEDDYGMQLGRTISERYSKHRDAGGSWEID